jgi:hypothetical protein
MSCANCCGSSALLEKIFGELRELRAEVAEIRALLRPRRCSSADIETLGRLLPAIGGKFGSDFFTTKGILSVAAIREVTRKSIGAVGALLSRASADALSIAGLIVERVGREHGSTVWRVLQVISESPQPLDKRRTFRV